MKHLHLLSGPQNIQRPSIHTRKYFALSLCLEQYVLNIMVEHFLSFELRNKFNRNSSLFIDILRPLTERIHIWSPLMIMRLSVAQ